MIANAKKPGGTSYAFLQTMWTDQGKETQKNWVSAPDTATGIRTNIKRGLLAFNHDYPDGVNVYFHPGHGFVDTFTGWLLWLGVAVILLNWYRKRSIPDADLLMLTGFLVVWLSLAFIFYKAPDYTRLLVILPFVAYFVARAAGAIARLASPLVKQAYIFAAIAIAIIATNVWIIKDFIDLGRKTGNPIGDTLRFQEKHSNEQVTWHFASTRTNTYVGIGTFVDIQHWLGFAIGGNQKLNILKAAELRTGEVEPAIGAQGAYLLTDQTLWSDAKQRFSAKYTVESETKLTPGGRLLVVKFDDK